MILRPRFLATTHSSLVRCLSISMNHLLIQSLQFIGLLEKARLYHEQHGRLALPCPQNGQIEVSFSIVDHVPYKGSDSKLCPSFNNKIIRHVICDFLNPPFNI